MVTEKISNLLHEYFALGVAEGKEGRNHDTDAGDAQRVLSKLESAIAALSTDAEPVTQCCMCGKKGLSTKEGDGGSECQLSDGRWVCSSDCWDRAVDPAPSVAVKALEWDGTQAMSEVGHYWIVNATKKWLYLDRVGKIGPFQNMDGAKAAAQADYEARIRSALA